MIKEAFLGFWSATKTDGESPFELLKKILDELNLPFKNIIAQGYDGGSNMKRKYKGLSSRVTEQNKKALCIHFYAHQLI